MDQKYPIGRWEAPVTISAEQIAQWISQIELVPDSLNMLLNGTDSSSLEKSYREGGWTLRQVIHHLADSHMNAYIRHKLAVTTDCPTINPYPEQKWAQLRDTAETDAMVSVRLMEALHQRWCAFLKSLGPDDFIRVFYHPSMGRVVRLGESVSLYAWHGRHHLAHIAMGLGKNIQ